MIAGNFDSTPAVTLVSEIEGDKFVALYNRPASRMEPAEVVSVVGGR